MKHYYLLSLFTFFLLFFSTASSAQDILVSGAGSTEVNGLYVETDIYGGKPVYTKGSYSIRFDCDMYACEGWYIFQNEYNALYYSYDEVDSPILVTTWQTAMGMSPVPSVQPGGLSAISPSAITANSAFLGGYVPDDTGNPVTERGIVYSVAENPTIADTKIAMGSGEGQFTQTVGGFMPSTTYYVRAYVVTGFGVEYSAQQQEFHTFASGDGSEFNPLGVSNWKQLSNIELNMDASYQLTADIGFDSEGYEELASSTANQNGGWYPIGTKKYNLTFTGALDGQNYNITGLYISREGQSGGLFNAMLEATISNLRLSEFHITGNSHAGALAGYIQDSTITNCHIINISVRGFMTGGLVGYLQGGLLTNCSVSGQVGVPSASKSGGIAGEMQFSSKILNCRTNVVMTGHDNVGGIVGNMVNSYVGNSYAAGSVSGGGTGIGGLVGYARGLNSQIINSYSTCAVTALGGKGGLVGILSGATITGSMYDLQTSGQSDTDRGIPKTTAEMKDISTFLAAGWDFSCETANGTNQYWTINPTDNNGYPALQHQNYYNIACPTWNGLVSSDWSVAGNWTPAAVPQPNETANIPVVTVNAFYPQLSDDATTRSLYIASGAYLDLNGYYLTVLGPIRGGGVLRTNSQSTLVLNGGDGEMLLNTDPAFNTVENLIINTNGSVKMTSPLAVVGTVDIQGGHLETNGHLIMKSTENATARISEVTGSISGNVTVERYIPAKRAWRALTAPLRGSATSIFSSWQNNGNVVAGTGMEIWGPAGTGMANGASYSVLNYTPTGYVNVTNTQSTMLFDNEINNAFLFFTTGAYGSGNISNTIPATSTTLVASGELITGDVAYNNIIDSRHTMIGNPYASPLYPQTLLDGNDNLINKFWVWDPELGLNGGYVSYDSVAGTYSNATGSYTSSTTAIQSGQAFFVRANPGTTGSFTITESKKSTEVADVFRPSNTLQATASQLTPEIIRLGMYRQQSQAWLPLDGAIAVIYPSADNAVDNNDGRKFANSSENLAFRNSNTSLSSEHRSPLSVQDTLHVRVWNTTPNNYKLHINTEAFATTNLVAILQDLYTNTETVFDLSGAVTEYPFTVTNDANSSGDRFRIVFTESALGINHPATQNITVYPNPVTAGIVHINTGSAVNNGNYDMVNMLGQVVKQGKLEPSQSAVDVSSLPSGIYMLQIQQTNKTLFTTKIIIK